MVHSIMLIRFVLHIGNRQTTELDLRRKAVVSFWHEGTFLLFGCWQFINYYFKSPLWKLPKHIMYTHVAPAPASLNGS